MTELQFAELMNAVESINNQIIMIDFSGFCYFLTGLFAALAFLIGLWVVNS